MIDPHNVINYNRTDYELEEWWLFSIVVAGKTAITQAKLLEKFLNSIREYGNTPFEMIKNANSKEVLLEKLQESRLGQYNRIFKAFVQSADILNLRDATVSELETIHGVGPKTARMFVMHSRENSNYAALDTHILKYLREYGYDVPKTTPSGKKYAELEAIFLRMAKFDGMSPSEYDLMVWKRYSTA